MNDDSNVLVVLVTERVVPSPLPFLVFLFLAACACALMRFPSRSPEYVVQRV